MESITTFLAMGGYAAFVWPAFGITALVMVALLVDSLRDLRQRQRRLAELEALHPNRKREPL